MLAITVKIGFDVLIDWKAIFIFLISAAIILIYKRISVAWIVLGSAMFGYLLLFMEKLFR